MMDQSFSSKGILQDNVVVKKLIYGVNPATAPRSLASLSSIQKAFYIELFQWFDGVVNFQRYYSFIRR